jgi:hypothetical protein
MRSRLVRSVGPAHSRLGRLQLGQDRVSSYRTVWTGMPQGSLRLDKLCNSLTISISSYFMLPEVDGCVRNLPNGFF